MFIAADTDLYPVLEEVERKYPIKYVLYEYLPMPEFTSYQSYVEIPDLGVSSTDSLMGSNAYFIFPKEAKINYMPVEWPNNEIVFAFDHILNPDSVCLTPGGMWKDEAVIAGEISSIYSDGFVKQIATVFRRKMKKTFYARVGVFWIGYCAKARYLEGKRLTNSTRSPRAYDLVLPGIPKISADDPEPVIVRPIYEEGDVYAVPLQKGGWAICVVARSKDRNMDGFVLGYFFGPKRDAIPAIDDITGLSPKKALIVVRCNADKIINGDWPFIGKLDKIDKAEWPYPDMFIIRGEFGTPSDDIGMVLEPSKLVMETLNEIMELKPNRLLSGIWGRMDALAKLGNVLLRKCGIFRGKKENTDRLGVIGIIFDNCAKAL